jgi:hypothetical protein
MITGGPGRRAITGTAPPRKTARKRRPYARVSLIDPRGPVWRCGGACTACSAMVTAQLTLPVGPCKAGRPPAGPGRWAPGWGPGEPLRSGYAWRRAPVPAARRARLAAGGIAARPGPASPRRSPAQGRRRAGRPSRRICPWGAVKGLRLV